MNPARNGPGFRTSERTAIGEMAAVIPDQEVYFAQERRPVQALQPDCGLVPIGIECAAGRRRRNVPTEGILQRISRRRLSYRLNRSRMVDLDDERVWIVKSQQGDLEAFEALIERRQRRNRLDLHIANPAPLANVKKPVRLASAKANSPWQGSHMMRRFDVKTLNVLIT